MKSYGTIKKLPFGHHCEMMKCWYRVFLYWLYLVLIRQYDYLFLQARRLYRMFKAVSAAYFSLLWFREGWHEYNDSIFMTQTAILAPYFSEEWS